MTDAHSVSFYKELFKEKICDKRTSEYLFDVETRQHLDAIILPRIASEVVLLETTSGKVANSQLNANTISVVLCNVDLASRAGSQLWVRDVAIGLTALGCRVLVFAPLLGDVAQEISAHGIKVTDKYEVVRDFQPAIIHINHWEACTGVVDQVPDALVVNMIHGLIPSPGMPGFERVDKYASVSMHAKAKVYALTEAAWDSIPIIPNFFDENLYSPPIPRQKTNRALIYSSKTTVEERSHLENLLSQVGMKVDHIGYGGLAVTSSPHDLLPQYDLVFAVARSAIEACASGANVVLWDAGIVGPALTADNFWNVVAANFSLASNSIPWGHISRNTDSEFIMEQIELATKQDPQTVASLVHTHLTLREACRRLLAVYGLT